MLVEDENRLPVEFFRRDVLEVAPELIGKKLIRQWPDGRTVRLSISETEAYRGEEDEACHARKGITERTSVMYAEGGLVYVFLIYGMYWMLNLVTGPVHHPQAVLIRGTTEIKGPGRLGKFLELNRSFYGEHLGHSQRIWIEEAPAPKKVFRSGRIGIDYASKQWKEKPWRFTSFLP